jgi:hypothetical protein
VCLLLFQDSLANLGSGNLNDVYNSVVKTEIESKVDFALSLVDRVHFEKSAADRDQVVFQGLGHY